MTKTIAVVLVVACLVMLFSYKLEVQSYTVYSKKVQNDMRIELLTDLHQTRHTKEIIEKVKESKPDAIMIAGDLINSSGTDFSYARDTRQLLGYK